MPSNSRSQGQEMTGPMTTAASILGFRAVAKRTANPWRELPMNTMRPGTAEAVPEHVVEDAVGAALPHLEAVDAVLQVLGELAELVEVAAVHQQYLRARRREQVEPRGHDVGLLEGVDRVLDGVKGLGGDDA